MLNKLVAMVTKIRIKIFKMLAVFAFAENILWKF